MIPLNVYEGKLFDISGNEVIPNGNGSVEFEVLGKKKKFVASKLIRYLEMNGQIYKKPVVRRLNHKKSKTNKTLKIRNKTGTAGHNRRRRVIITDSCGNINEFESITKAASELKICRSKMFSVLNGRLKTLKGYKIKYAV